MFVDARVESLREASQPGVVSVLLLKNVSMPDLCGNQVRALQAIDASA